jgi:serine/threonine-protein kinase RsbW
MNGMRSRNEAPNPQPNYSEPKFSAKRSRSSILEIDSWMPSKIQAISPLVDRLMRLIERAKCVPGAEFDLALAIREALGNAVVHGNQENPDKKVHLRCRCESANEVSIVVTDEGTGFDFLRIIGNGLTSDPADAHGHGIQLMRAYINDVRFERGGSEIHNAQAFASCVFFIKRHGLGTSFEIDATKPMG